MNKTSFKKLATGLSALGLLVAATPSLAIPTLSFTPTNYPAAVVDPFGGLDWNSAGTAVSVGYNPFAAVNVGLTTTYWATAGLIKDPSGSDVTPDNIQSSIHPDGYEFTVKAVITETSVCLVSAGGGPVGPGNPCAIALFSATGGTYDIYFDPLGNANLATGAGITDGTKVISGGINSGVAGTFTATGAGGAGVFNFTGSVTYTNNAFINPDLDFTRATSTLQIGNATGGWTPPSSLPGAAGGTVALPTTYLGFQADGNQTFGIPEPGTLALLGLSLVGFGFTTRRRKG